MEYLDQAPKNQGMVSQTTEKVLSGQHNSIKSVKQPSKLKHMTFFRSDTNKDSNQIAFPYAKIVLMQKGSKYTACSYVERQCVPELHYTW
jgi:hypothetical protein